MILKRISKRLRAWFQIAAIRLQHLARRFLRWLSMFLWNRIALPLYISMGDFAAKMIAEGIASPNDFDGEEKYMDFDDEDRDEWHWR